MQRGAGFFPAPAASHFVSRSFKEQEWGPGFPKEVLLGRILETKNRLSEFQITGLNRDLSGNRTRVYAVRGRRLDRLTIRPYAVLFCLFVIDLYMIARPDGFVKYFLKKVESFFE